MSLKFNYFDSHTGEYLKDDKGNDVITELNHTILESLIPKDTILTIAVVDERTTVNDLETNHPRGHRMVLGGSQFIYADEAIADIVERYFFQCEEENIFGVKDSCAYGSLLTSECGGKNEQIRVGFVDENSPEAEYLAAEDAWLNFEKTGVLLANLDSSIFKGEDPETVPQLLLPARVVEGANPDLVYIQTPKELAERFNTNARKIELNPAILTRKLNVLVVDDETGDSGGVFDHHCAKQILKRRLDNDQIADIYENGDLRDALTPEEFIEMELAAKELARSNLGDCAGVGSLELVNGKFGTDHRKAVQFRGSFKDFDKGLEGKTGNLEHAGKAVDKICKGSLVGFDMDSIDWGKAGKPDIILPKSSFKGAIKPAVGMENREMWLSDKDISRKGTQSISSIISLLPEVLADIIPVIEPKLANLAAIQNDYTKLATLYCETYEKRQAQYIEDQSEDNAFTNQFSEESSSEPEVAIELPSEKYKLFKAILDSQNYTLLQSSLCIQELKKFVRSEFLNLSQGIDPDIKFDRGFARPSKDLEDGEICVPWMAEGAEIIVTRPPLIDTNGVHVLINKYVGFDASTPIKDRPNFISCNDDSKSSLNDREAAKFESCIEDLRLKVKEALLVDDAKLAAESELLLAVNLHLLADLKQRPVGQSVMKDFALDFDGDCLGVALATDYRNLAEAVKKAQLNGGFDPVRSIEDLPGVMQEKLATRGEEIRMKADASSYLPAGIDSDDSLVAGLKVRFPSLSNDLLAIEREVNRYPDTIKEGKKEFLGMTKEAAALQMMNTCVGVIANTMTKIQSQISSINLITHPQNGATDVERSDYCNLIKEKNTEYIASFQKRAKASGILEAQMPKEINKSQTIGEFFNNPEDVAKFNKFLATSAEQKTYITANAETYFNFKNVNKSQTVGDFIKSQKEFIVTPNNLSEDSNIEFKNASTRIEARTNVLAKMPEVNALYPSKDGALAKDDASYSMNRESVLNSLETFSNNGWVDKLKKDFNSEGGNCYWKNIQKDIAKLQSQSKLLGEQLKLNKGDSSDVIFDSYSQLQKDISSFKLATEKALLRELVPIGAKQNQAAVDMPKSARVADMNAISALNKFNTTDLKIITEKKQKTILSSVKNTFTVGKNEYNPLAFLANRVNNYFQDNLLKAEKPKSFRSLFPDDYSAKQYSAMLAAKHEFDRDWNLGVRQSLKSKDEGGAVLQIKDSKGRSLEITNINKFDCKLSYSPEELKGKTFALMRNTIDPDYDNGELKGIATSHQYIVVLVDKLKPGEKADSNKKPEIIGTLCEFSKNEFVKQNGLKELATFDEVELCAPSPNLADVSFTKARDFAARFAQSVPENERMSYAAALWHESTDKKGVDVDSPSYTDTANSMTSSMCYFWMDQLEQQIKNADLTLHKLAFLDSQAELALGTQIQFEVAKGAIPTKGDSELIRSVLSVEGNPLAYVLPQSYPIDATGKAFTGVISQTPPDTLLMKLPGCDEYMTISKCPDYACADKAWDNNNDCKIALQVINTTTQSLKFEGVDLGKIENRALDLLTELGMINIPVVESEKDKAVDSGKPVGLKTKAQKAEESEAQAQKAVELSQNIIITPRSHEGSIYLQIEIPAKGDRDKYTFGLNRNIKDGKDPVDYAALGFVVNKPVEAKLDLEAKASYNLGIYAEKPDGKYEAIGHILHNAKVANSDGKESYALGEFVKQGLIDMPGLTKEPNGLVTGKPSSSRAEPVVLQRIVEGVSVVNTNKAYGIKIDKDIEPVPVPVRQADYTPGFIGTYFAQHAPVITGVSTLGSMAAPKTLLSINFTPKSIAMPEVLEAPVVPQNLAVLAIDTPINKLESEINGVTTVQSKAKLIEDIQSGQKPDLLLFYGHQVNKEIDASCLSQHYPRSFKDDEGVTYPTAEHYMMAEKAKLFNDMPMLAKILEADTPSAAKFLGRHVGKSDDAIPFDDKVWDANCAQIVAEGNMLKFSQNPDLKEFLLSTDNKVLVEASPSDRKWGIGMSKDNPDAQDPQQWQGENQLGFALMNARDVIRSQELNLAVNDFIQSDLVTTRFNQEWQEAIDDPGESGNYTSIEEFIKSEQEYRHSGLPEGYYGSAIGGSNSIAFIAIEDVVYTVVSCERDSDPLFSRTDFADVEVLATINTQHSSDDHLSQIIKTSKEVNAELYAMSEELNKEANEAFVEYMFKINNPEQGTMPARALSIEEKIATDPAFAGAQREMMKREFDRGAPGLRVIPPVSDSPKLAVKSSSDSSKAPKPVRKNVGIGE